MGLTVRIKGYEGAYDCGYITYGNFILDLIEHAYNKRLRDEFSDYMFSGERFTEDFVDRWSKVSDPNLDIFIFHSDCDGRFTPQECRKIAKALKRVPYFESHGHNYGDMKPYNMLDKFIDMFDYCAKHRVCMFYT